MASSLAIGLVTSVINTRSLGPQAYGDLKFIGTLFLFLSTISTLGLFNTGSQGLAELMNEGAKRRELVGTLIVIAGLISGTFMLGAMLFSFFEPRLFANDLQLEIFLFSPLVALFILQSCIEEILQGENRIHELSLLRVLPGMLFMVFLLISAGLHWLSLNTTLTLQLIASSAVVYGALRRLRPTFAHLKENTKLLWRANRGYGWYVYLGILSNVATGYLSTFMISYFLDNTKVGFFSLATALTMPLASLAGVVGTTYFREFAHRNSIPSKVTFVTVAISGATLILFLVVIRPIVFLVYTEKFIEVASLAGIIAFGAALHGFGDYFNRFLGAHALGKELMKGAAANGVVNVIGYIVLVKYFGVQGAAVTRVFASGTYCAMMVFYYFKFRTKRDLPTGF
jgi:O-antigen/teichoic acid export membrane protein